MNDEITLSEWEQTLLMAGLKMIAQALETSELDEDRLIAEDCRNVEAKLFRVWAHLKPH